MIVKIHIGIGNAGKLWTGSNLTGHEGRYAKVELVEFRSPQSSASTRRLYIHESQDTPPEGIRVPTLHISVGGVGSLVSRTIIRDEVTLEPTTEEGNENWLMPLLVWNWSGRVGGYLILDPVRVESGYIQGTEVNTALPGYAWIKTYDGSTMSEYALVKVSQSSPSDDSPHQPSLVIDNNHILPIHRIVHTVLSPPERESQTEAKALAQRVQDVMTGKQSHCA